MFVVLWTHRVSAARDAARATCRGPAVPVVPAVPAVVTHPTRTRHCTEPRLAPLHYNLTRWLFIIKSIFFCFIHCGLGSLDVLGWRCESGCRIEASRVGSDRIGPHRRISGGHLNICRVDVMFPFGCWISYWIVDDRSGPARSLRTPRWIRIRTFGYEYSN